MQKIYTIGRYFYVFGMMTLAVLQLVLGEFIIGRPPAWPAGVPGKMIWLIAYSVVVVMSGFAILLEKRPARAAWAMAGSVILSSFLLLHLIDLLSAGAENFIWRLNAFKTLALAGGAWIVGASFDGVGDEDSKPVFTNRNLLFAGQFFLSFFLVLGGCSHVKFSDFVFDFIPAYIPFHVFWTYFCAAALIAGGVGMFVSKTRWLAAFLSGLMIFLWFIMLHIPRALAAPNDLGEWEGVIESLTMSGSLFVLAGIFAKKKS